MLTLKRIIEGIAAGIMIAIGGTVYLSCDNKYVGAFFFSVALLCICMKGYSLFTGKVGYIPECHTKSDVAVLFLGLLGNLIATVLFGIALSYAIPAISATAVDICKTKLAQGALQTFIRSVFCGILMYLAVSIYKENKTVVGIFFCVPVFILSGFEHSIANMFYFAAANMISTSVIIYIVIVLAGNAVGGMLMPILKRLGSLAKE